MVKDAVYVGSFGSRRRNVDRIPDASLGILHVALLIGHTNVAECADRWARAEQGRDERPPSVMNLRHVRGIPGSGGGQLLATTTRKVSAVLAPSIVALNYVVDENTRICGHDKRRRQSTWVTSLPDADVTQIGMEVRHNDFNEGERRRCYRSESRVPGRGGRRCPGVDIGLRRGTGGIPKELTPATRVVRRRRLE